MLVYTRRCAPKMLFIFLSQSTVVRCLYCCSDTWRGRHTQGSPSHPLPSLACDRDSTAVFSVQCSIAKDIYSVVVDVTRAGSGLFAKDA